MSLTLDPVSKQSFSRFLTDHGLTLRRGRTDRFQLNVGKLYDLTCVHCHVNAGPKRKEVITRETIDRILHWLARTKIPTVDLTGGAPEMAPDFRYLVEHLRKSKIDRSLSVTIVLVARQERAVLAAEH